MARILVVDDEDTILDTLGRMLARAGHEVYIAHSADEAIGAIDRYGPDIAIVDLVMPGKGGLTLIMEHLASKPDLGIIAMSGRIPVGTDSMLGLGATLKIDCFLPKPFTPEEVTEVLGRALARRCAS